MSCLPDSPRLNQKTGRHLCVAEARSEMDEGMTDHAPSEAQDPHRFGAKRAHMGQPSRRIRRCES